MKQPVREQRKKGLWEAVGASPSDRACAEGLVPRFAAGSQLKWGRSPCGDTATVTAWGPRSVCSVIVSQMPQLGRLSLFPASMGREGQSKAGESPRRQGPGTAGGCGDVCPFPGGASSAGADLSPL